MPKPPENVLPQGLPALLAGCYFLVAADTALLSEKICLIAGGPSPRFPTPAGPDGLRCVTSLQGPPSQGSLAELGRETKRVAGMGSDPESAELAEIDPTTRWTQA